MCCRFVHSKFLQLTLTQHCIHYLPGWLARGGPWSVPVTIYTSQIDVVSRCSISSGSAHITKELIQGELKFQTTQFSCGICKVKIRLLHLYIIMLTCYCCRIISILTYSCLLTFISYIYVHTKLTMVACRIHWYIDTLVYISSVCISSTTPPE